MNGNTASATPDVPLLADPLAALRAATAQRHEVLDQSMPLASAAPTLSHYAEHLQLLRAWLGPLEEWLAGFADGPQGAASPAAKYRLDLIDADLADAAPAIDVSAWDTAPPAGWSDHASAAYRWGVCYVIEGSQLGGAVLYKRHAERLAPHPLRYLRGDGSPGPRWQQFMAALRAAVNQPAAIEQACTGARDAFDRLLALQSTRAATVAAKR